MRNDIDIEQNLRWFGGKMLHRHQITNKNHWEWQWDSHCQRWKTCWLEKKHSQCWPQPMQLTMGPKLVRVDDGLERVSLLFFMAPSFHLLRTRNQPFYLWCWNLRDLDGGSTWLMKGIIQSHIERSLHHWFWAPPMLDRSVFLCFTIVPSIWESIESKSQLSHHPPHTTKRRLWDCCDQRGSCLEAEDMLEIYGNMGIPWFRSNFLNFR